MESFEERWGFAPDSDYEELGCNMTPQEIKEFYERCDKKLKKCRFVNDVRPQLDAWRRLLLPQSK